MAGAFEQRWHELMATLGIDTVPGEAVLMDLAAAYSHPSRHYHDRVHIEDLLGLTERFRSLAEKPVELELAVYFHDAVYDIGASDNEARSAELARASLQRLGCGSDLIISVVEAVLATAHTDNRNVHGDAQLLADLDLAILAADVARYDHYAAAIRREYAVYPDDVYRGGRRRVLSALLGRSRLYARNDLAALWDARARANVLREMQALS